MSVKEMRRLIETLEEEWIPEKYTVRVVDEHGHVIDQTDEPYEGTSYMFDTAKRMMLQVPVGGKIEILKHH